MLTEKQIKVIDLLMQNVPKTTIEREVDVSRTTIYKWLNTDEEFNAELRRREQTFKSFVSKQINSKIETAVDELWELRHDIKDSKVKFDIYTYFINRALGTPTNKTEISDTRDDQKDSGDVLADELEQWTQQIKEEKQQQQELH